MTHSFVSEKTTRGLHHKPKRSKALFKVVNSVVKLTMGIVSSTPLKVGDWFGVLVLIVVPMDDHSVVLGQDFLRLLKSVSIPHMNFLMFMNKIETFDVHMMTRRKLRWIPRILDINLIKESSEPMDKPHAIAKQQSENILGKTTLGAQVGVVKVDNKMANVGSKDGLSHKEG